MSKILVALFISFHSLNLFAGIEIGTWKGKISESANCFIDVGDQTFENNLKHPLNERISFTIGSIKYSVHHPYLMNLKDGSVSFNHEQLEAVTPTSNGTYALQIQLKEEVPTSVYIMEHNWKTGDKEIIYCTDLKKVF
jgi:hypothetical protein